MDKEISLNIDEKLYEKLDKQFKTFGVDFQEGIKIVLETFVDENEGFGKPESTTKRGYKPVNINPDSNEMTKSFAITIFNRLGFEIFRPCTYASRGDYNKSNYGFYWANPSFDYLKQDWNIILNEKYQKKLTLLKVPKDAFQKHNLRERTDKGLIDLRIQCDDNYYTDLSSGQRFRDYVVAVVDYSNLDNPILL